MKIAIIGLGLIGGSLARAIREKNAHTLYGYDKNPAVTAAALAAGVLDAPLTPERLGQCDLVAVALFPAAIVDWLKQNAAVIPKTAIVFDCGGIKAPVCAAGFALAAQHGFAFFGGHPMAGTERSGWAAARADLFAGASMLLVPPEGAADDGGTEGGDSRRGERPAQGMSDSKKGTDGRTAAQLDILRAFFLSLGFGRVVVTTAAEHDRTIAYTSQLAHVVSSAYIKSPTAQNYVGFSAGSFKDMTRVAFLNEAMWTELFLDNRGPLGEEIDFLIARLREYRDALAAGEEDTLYRLLHEGKELKLLSEQAGQTAGQKKGEGK